METTTDVRVTQDTDVRVPKLAENDTMLLILKSNDAYVNVYFEDREKFVNLYVILKMYFGQSHNAAV